MSTLGIGGSIQRVGQLIEVGEDSDPFVTQPDFHTRQIDGIFRREVQRHVAGQEIAIDQVGKIGTGGRVVDDDIDRFRGCAVGNIRHRYRHHMRPIGQQITGHIFRRVVQICRHPKTGAIKKEFHRLHANVLAHHRIDGKSTGQHGIRHGLGDNQIRGCLVNIDGQRGRGRITRLVLHGRCQRLRPFIVQGRIKEKGLLTAGFSR